jgi:FtsP/CotA-like multicopper oxidase with cupredoxin domain
LPNIPVATGERLRLRLINATSANGISIKLEGHALWVMAIDGQPAEPFVARASRFALAPGSRVDLFVDAMQAPGAVAPLLAGGGELQPIARLLYAPEAGAYKARQPVPKPLPPNPLPARIDLRTALRAELALVAAQPLNPAGPPLFAVRRGRAVTLSLRNRAGGAEVVHVHGHSFRLLYRLDDGWKPYWLDTLVVGDETERIAFVADNPGRWRIVWRMLEQPSSEAAAWFAVT